MTALLLEGGKKGILDPLGKDGEGKDLFDCVAETGTAGLYAEAVYTVCIFAEGNLKRKLKFSGSGVKHSFVIYGDKIYVGAYGLAFTLNLDTGQAGRAFYPSYTGGNADIYIYMFPFGNSDMVYTYIIGYGK